MSEQGPIKNAEKIIEAFGGLRPMSSKTGVAVTTIQGWKKRGVIPAQRKASILKAAQKHDIDVASLLGGKTPAKPVEKPAAVKAVEEEPPITVEKAEEPKVEEKAVAVDVPKDEPKSEQKPVETTVNEPTSEPLKAEVKKQPQKVLNKGLSQKAEQRAVLKSVAIAASFVLLLGAGAVAFLLPDYEEFGSHGKRLSEIESDVSAIKKQQTMFKGLVPENWDRQLADLKNQAQSARDMVSQTVADVKRATQDLDKYEIEKRVQSLQGYVSEMTGEQSIYAMMSRLDQMRQDYSGNKTLDQASLDLLTLFKSQPEETVESDMQVNALLDSARNQSAALGQTFANVPQSDLKAAAMLFALTQLRASLNREQEPFQEDLALLMNVVGSEDPTLVESINKMAPYSESGLMSVTGIQREFRSIAGEVVVESLKGENVSISEKLSARVNNLLQVEKDGELITGTKTQATVAKADNYLQNGQFDEALSLLKRNLNSKELKPLKPWIQHVEGVLASRDVKRALEQAIELNSGAGYLGGSSILQP